MVYSRLQMVSRVKKQVADEDCRNNSNKVCQQSADHGMTCFAYAYSAKIDRQYVECSVGATLEDAA